MQRYTMVLVCCFVLVASVAMQAGTVTFTPASSGSMGVSSKSYGPITLTAYYYNTVSNSWQLSLLWGRNEAAPEQGVGVCSEGVSACNSGGGDVNEISDETNKELIQLTLASGYTWQSLGLGSLDMNNIGLAEQGAVGLSPTSQFCEFASNGAGVGCTNSGGFMPDIGLGSGLGNQTLYVYSLNWDSLNATNNDFLLRSASYTQNVPEPASLFLLGSSFLGLAGTLRRKLK